MKRKKHSSFSDYVLNDDKIVIPILMGMASWFGLFLCMIFVYILSFKNPFFYLFFLGLIFTTARLVKVYRLGGFKKVYSGHSANKVVWKR